MNRKSLSARPQLLKQINAGNILTRILNEGAVSRAELARKDGISPPTVSALINDLIEDGILIEVGRGESSRGRKPVLLKINPQGPVVIAASIRPTHFVYGTTDLLSNLDNMQNEYFSLADPPEETITRLTNLIKPLIKSIENSGNQLLGFGISTPGLLRVNDDSVILSPNQPHWHEVPLGKMLRERLQIPVFVENDARAVALAEISYGTAKKYRNIIVFTVAEGVGAGIVVDGRIYYGKSGHAGEIGHTVVDPDGRLCGCGKRGCLETMASESAFIQSVKLRLKNSSHTSELSEDNLSFEKILQAFEKDDPVAIAAIDEVSYYLGTGMANIINAFEPESLILWGRFFFHTPIVEKSKKVMREKALATCLDELHLKISNMGEEATLKGAAARVIRRKLLAPHI